ncbi:SIR2 family protein [Ensifer sp. ENS10]|uniref:SIR2 family protein n=1 Tax=unclassified Ensifer TaxID=2633371 RepID=UPI00138EEACB|nr:MULTISPECIES: SIR2 family protein [unclassified Ensifer]MBD9506775.1 SIR2 family protein [Ensifer sp. ENS10]
MSFVKISNEQHDAFVSSLKAGQYNLLLGAGVSLDSENSIGKLPSGTTLRDELCDLKGVSKNKSLQKVFALLSESEVDQYITKRFSGCTAGATLSTLSTFVWRRAFTWNIDDALEAAYRLKGAKQKLVTAHFRDDYNDERVLSDLLLVKLHGSVTHASKGYVFARDEYIQVMKENSPWMTVLSQFLTNGIQKYSSRKDNWCRSSGILFRFRVGSVEPKAPGIRVEVLLRARSRMVGF